MRDSLKIIPYYIAVDTSNLIRLCRVLNTSTDIAKVLSMIGNLLVGTSEFPDFRYPTDAVPLSVLLYCYSLGWPDASTNGIIRYGRIDKKCIVEFSMSASRPFWWHKTVPTGRYRR
jgi:hypothetical protein